jgi:tripartite-type tricarboxylate transporter receptor subunit TctC
MVARLVTEPLMRLWGQQIIVDNRGGASGTIAGAFVAKSAADGYTLLHCNIAPNAISYAMIAKMQYSPDDFAPISRIGMPPNIIVVHPSVPLKSITQLVEFAKSNPGRLSYASGTVGTSPHLTMEWLKLRMKFDIVHVPYKNSGQGTSDVIAGQLPINVTNFPILVAPIKAGRLRALAVASAERQALLPDVPTMRAAGVPDFEVNSWYGVCAPAGTPTGVLDKVNADLHTVLRSREVDQRLSEMGMPPAPNSRADFEKFIRNEIDRWAQVVRDANIPKM